MRVKFWIFILMCLTLPLSGQAAEPGWNLEQLMAAMAQNKSGEARFVEKKTSDLLDEPVVTRGTLSFTPPDRLEKHILSPYDERYQVNGDTLLVENKRKNIHRRLSLQRYPAIWAFVESFRATLAGDLPDLQRFYTVGLEGSKQNWSLLLTPTEGQMQKVVESIRIQGRNGRVERIRIDEVNGDQSSMRIEKAAP